MPAPQPHRHTTCPIGDNPSLSAPQGELTRKGNGPPKRAVMPGSHPHRREGRLPTGFVICSSYDLI